MPKSSGVNHIYVVTLINLLAKASSNVCQHETGYEGCVMDTDDKLYTNSIRLIR